MGSKANPKLIGAFALGAILLLVIAIIAVGGGKLFRQTIPVVMYFPRSVAGLNVGAPVTFRGVKLGEVTNIFLGYDPKSRNVVIPVFAELFPQSIVNLGDMNARGREGGPKDVIRDYIKNRGLRAQLTVSSLVTGQLVVNFDFFPYAVFDSESEATNIYPDRIQIPTIPSTLEEVQATLQDLYRKLEKLPLDEMIADARAVLQGANRLVNSPEINNAVIDFTKTLSALRSASTTMENAMLPLIALVEFDGQHRQLDAALDPHPRGRQSQRRRGQRQGARRLARNAGVDADVREQRQHPDRARFAAQLRTRQRAQRGGGGRPRALRPRQHSRTHSERGDLRAHAAGGPPTVKLAPLQLAHAGLVAVCLSVAGCFLPSGGSAPINYYVLTARAAQDPALASGGTRLVGVQTVQLPDYLNHKLIVTRLKDNEIDLAEFDQWAGNLNDNITNVLVENLARVLGTDDVVALPVSAAVPIEDVVVVEIVNFERQPSGTVRLNARWIVLEQGGRTFHSIDQGVYEAPNIAPDYVSIASAMSDILAAFSRDIAHSLAAQLPPFVNSGRSSG